MSNNLAVSVSINGNSTSYLSAIGSAKNATASLGSSAALLKAKHVELGNTIKWQMGTQAPHAVKVLNQEYIKIGHTLDQLHLKQNKLNNLTDKFNATRSELGSQLGSTAAFAIGTAIPVKLAIDFESAMADVRKVVDFSTPADFVRFGDIIKAMSRDIPIAATGLAQIAASGGQLGIKEIDLPSFTRTVAKMSTAFDMMPQEAGDAMAKLANAYSIPVKDITRLGDAINHLSNNSPAKASDLVRAMGRISGVSKIFGLTEVQAASLANAFISIGKAPEVAGTAINAMLQKLGTADKQGAKFQRALAEIGTDAAQMKKLIENDAQGAVISFLKAIEQLPKKDQMGTLVDLFGLEYSDDIAAMTGALDQYIKSVELVADQKSFGGSMDKEFAERANTTANRLTLAKNGLVELGIGIGETLRPALNSLLETVTPMLHSATAWVSKNQGIVRSLASVLVGVAALKIGSLGLRYGFAVAGSGATSLMRIFTGTAIRFQWLRSMFTTGAPRMALAFRIFGAAEGTAGKLAGGIGKLSRMLVGGFQAALPWVGRIAMTLLRLSPIGLALSAVGLVVYKYWQPIKGFFVGLWQGLSSVAAPAIKTLMQSILSFGTVVGKAFLAFSGFGLAFKLIRIVAAPVFNTIISGLRSAWSWFNNLIKPVNDVGDKAQNMGQRVGSAIGNIIKALVGLPIKFLKLGSDIVGGLINGIQNKIGDAVNAVSELGSTVASKFKSVLGIHSPSRIFMGFGDNIAQGTAIGIQRSSAHASTAAGNMANSTVQAVSDLGTTVADKFKSAIGVNLFSSNDFGAGDNFIKAVNTGIQGNTLKAGIATENTPFRPVQSVLDLSTVVAKDAPIGLQRNLPQTNYLPVPANRSPMGVGNTAQGAAIDKLQNTSQANPDANRVAHSTVTAASKLGTPATASTLAAASKVGTPSAATPLNRGAQADTTGAGMTVHLNQTFNLDSGGKDIKGQIQQAAQMSMQEFERMMKRVLADQKRRGYA